MFNFIKRPFQYLKVLSTLKALGSKFDELKGATSMTARFGIISSLIAIAMQLGAQISPLIPDEYKHILLSIHILLEAGAKIIAHYSNPDGTSAKAPWIPEEKK